MAPNPYPNLPYDPCPGDLEGYRALCGYANRSASTVEQAARVLTMMQSPEWAGRTADAFREHVNANVLPLVHTAAASVGKAAGALRAWSLTLASLQDQARALNQQAEPCATQLAAANRSLPAGQQVTPGQSPSSFLANPLTPALTPAQKAARGSAEAAAGTMNSINRRVDDLHQQYLAAVRQCSSQLDVAGNMAPKAPGLLDSLGHDIEHYWDDAVGGLDALVHDAKIWEVLSEGANLVGTVAGVLAAFPPLSAVFGPIALVATTVALVSDTILASFDGGSWVSVGLDAVALIGGRLVVKSAKTLTQVYREAGAAKALEHPSMAGLLSKSDLILKVPGVGDAVKGAEQTTKAAPGLFRMIGQTFKDPAGTSELSKAINLEGAPDELLAKAAKWRGVNLFCSGIGWALTGASIPGTVSNLHLLTGDNGSGGSS